MKFFNFEVVIEKEPDDPGYSAFCPNLPGCFGAGATIEEAKRSIRAALQQHIETLLAHAPPVPQNENL